MTSRSPYAIERVGHKTTLLRPSASPQPYTQRPPPADARVIEYRSGEFTLPAYVNAARRIH